MDHTNQHWKFVAKHDQRQTPTDVSKIAIFSSVRFLRSLDISWSALPCTETPDYASQAITSSSLWPVCDVLQALFAMPLSVGMLSTSEWRYGIPACYCMVISMLSLAPTSIFTMTLMALNRCYKIVKPAKYHIIFTKRFIIVTGALSWIASILDSILNLLSASTSVPIQILLFAR